MADFSHILATRPDFDDEDREWLHHLVADWQVIADLSFADLLLLVQDGDGKYVVAEQCRPSTVMTLRAEDVVGNVMPDDMVGELDAAMLSSVVFRSTVLRTVGKATVCNVYAPVRHNGKTLGLVVRETNMATRESNGRYDSARPIPLQGFGDEPTPYRSRGGRLHHPDHGRRGSIRSPERHQLL